MPEFLRRLLSSDEFMPHGHCYLWRPEIVWLHLISDLLIGLSYTGISLALIYFARRRRDARFYSILSCFALFIVACGAAHYMEAVTLWTPVYRLSGVIKAITAIASVATAILLFRLLPEALAVPTPGQYRKANEALMLHGEILRNMAEGVSLTRASDQVVVYTNPKFDQMLGYEPGELLGKPIATIYFETEKGWGPVEQKIISDIQSRGECSYEVHNRKKDGTGVWCRANATVLDHPKYGQVWVAVRQDITERKRAEELLKKSQEELEQRVKERSEQLLKAEEQLRQGQKLEAVGSLAGGVAHDFNNILSVILGHASLLLDTLPKDAPLRDDLGEIQRAGQRAASLTQQLLAFSRRQLLRPQIVNLRNVVINTRKMLERLIGEHIELSTVIPNVLGEINVDTSQIEQVIMNLVVNSRDAMPEGGVLTIELADVELDPAAAAQSGVEPGPYVMLVVRDSGVGMDPATQQRIFEPFFTTKSHGRGTGLGLSTVFGIVQQSGGSIGVESQLGVGTTFRLYFPRVDGAKKSLSPPSSVASVPRGSETILLVEDDPQVRRLAKTVLSRQGYEVLEAASGADALELCQRHPGVIDLLLTDVVMPRMSGRQLAERLLQMRPDVAVLYMSGYTDDAIVRHGVLDWGMWFLQKPLTAQLLAEKVREVLNSRSTPARQN